MREYAPLDVNITKQQMVVNKIIELLKDNKIDYVADGIVDIRILEMMMYDVPFDSILCRYDESKTTYSGNLASYGYKVYRGSGLLRSLKYYVIMDMPMRGFAALKEFENKKFSELTRPYQRRVTETIITLLVDNSFQDDDVVIKDYLDVMKNCF